MMTHDTQHPFEPETRLNWLFFDLNSFFASVEQQEQPALRGRPVAVVPMMTDSTCAIAASKEAKSYGIKTGTKIYDAKKMCPTLICVQARHDVYVKYHHMIMDEVENHIPISKTCSIDEAACRLYENESTAEAATRIAENIKQGLRDNVGEHVKCSIGIAQNMFLSKIATELQKPDGLVILQPNNYTEQIFQMKLSDLTGIGRNIERRLNRAGIFTIKHLWDTSPKHARKIWGSVAGEQFWYKLHGYDIPDRPTQKSVIGHSRVLDPAHRPQAHALNITRQLTIKAASRLRRYNLYAQRFTLSVRTINHQRWAHEASFTPSQDNFTFIRALERMWQRMSIDTKRSNLLKTSITIHGLYERENVTLDLFADNHTHTAKDTALSSTIDSLNEKYGAQTISIGTCPKTLSGHVGTKIAFTRIPETAEFHE